MKKIAVVYRSKYGMTEKYANWIGEELQADVLAGKTRTIEDLDTYETLVFGGNIFASSITGAAFIKKHFDKLKGRQLLVFTTGLTSTNRSDAYLAVIDKNFPKEMQAVIQFFHFRGGIDYGTLSFKHRAMMGMLKTVLARKKTQDLHPDDIELLENYGGHVDFSDKTTIQPLISSVTEK